MKLAVFGGTFNPLHIGHAMLADTIIKELGYDKVLFVSLFLTVSLKLKPAKLTGVEFHILMTLLSF